MKATAQNAPKSAAFRVRSSQVPHSEFRTPTIGLPARVRERHGAPACLRERRGAALIVAIAVMTILLAIALTFFTVSRTQLKTATNVENAVRADLLANAATAIGIDMLQRDKVLHPTYTSVDHAWRTRFNNSYIAGKQWAYPGVTSPFPGGSNVLPSVFYHDESGRPGVRYTPGIDANGDSGADGLMDHLYVPRTEPSFVVRPENPSTGEGYNPAVNPFVVDPLSSLLAAEQISGFTDVDNDEDGHRDSVWFPLVADRSFATINDEDRVPYVLGDGLDNDLDTLLDEPASYEFVPLPPAEAGTFLYFGGADGLDNDGDGLVDEDDEQFMPGQPGVPRVFVTAPIMVPRMQGNRVIVDDPETGQPALDFLTLVNVTVYDADNNERLFTIDTDPGLSFPQRWVDVLDNDYDGIINRHREYYCWIGDPSGPQTPSGDPVTAGVLSVAEFDRILGAQEINPEYLPASVSAYWRVKSTGEPVCDIIGRAAVLITDEASKINLNVAGGHSFDQAMALGETNPFRNALNQGASVHEYSTLVLPQSGPARSRYLWQLLMGAPSGTTTDINRPDYVADVTLPGYGFADDNGNALALAMNGIDDDGDGLIDEGVNDGAIVTLVERRAFPGETNAEIADRYLAQLGRFEGIDEPQEFQRLNPWRNMIAEEEQLTEDATPAIGRLGDRNLHTREEINRITEDDNVQRDLFKLMKNFITLHSTDSGNANMHAQVTETAVIGPEEVDDDLKRPNRLKLSLSHAGPRQIAEHLRVNWGLESPVAEYRLGSAGGNLQFALGLQLEGLTVKMDDPFPLYGGTAEFASPVPFADDDGNPLNGPDGQPVPFNADPYLRALQLGVNLKDLRDSDHVRSEEQFAFDDAWWAAQQEAAGVPAADVERRQITHTVAGNEGIRINEMMVRPVRRVEAEMVNDPDFPAFNPNAFSFFYEYYRLPDTRREYADFDIGREFIQESINFLVNNSAGRFEWAEGPPATRLWAMPGELGNTSIRSYLGDGAYPSTTYPVYTEAQINNLGYQNGTIPIRVTRNANGTPANRIINCPNIIEFSFVPRPGLPPGRYYLTFSTKDGDGRPTILNSNRIRVATKYMARVAGNRAFGPTPYSPFNNTDPLLPPIDMYMVAAGNDSTGVPRTITRDVMTRFFQVADAGGDGDAFFTDDYWQNYWQEPILGATAPRTGLPDWVLDGDDGEQASGWVFCPTLQRGDTTLPDLPDDLEDGYAQDDAFTVTIPSYADPTDSTSIQIELHVAIALAPGATVDPENIVINFFDFSQEPDHEWIEVENISGQDIDISGWQVVVGGNGTSDPALNAAHVVLEVPSAVVLTANPPNNRLLLAFNGRDYFEYPGTVSGILYNNGIGCVGGLINDSTDVFDFRDVTFPMMPPRDPQYWAVSGRGGPISAPTSEIDPLNIFERADPTGDQRQIVQLVVPRDPVTNADLAWYYGRTYADIFGSESPAELKEGTASFVLGGGVFPNYPEHDNLDNDNDSGPTDGSGTYKQLMSDGVDNNGDSFYLGGVFGVDNFGPWPNTTLYQDPFNRPEGVDEGRPRGERPAWPGDPLNAEFDPILDPLDWPGFLLGNAALIPYHVPDPGAFSGILPGYTMGFRVPGEVGFPYATEWGSVPGQSTPPTYMGLPAPNPFPPDWKEFVERRFFPGDNVFLTLTTPNPDLTTAVDDIIVDRVTYTERDVINRCIDEGTTFDGVTFDVRRIPGQFGAIPDDQVALRDTLHGPLFDPNMLPFYNQYQTFWPDNTMGVDFYRTLERKHHPVYNGDRFGTSNRWEPTDGNYDDWSHDFPANRRLIDRPDITDEVVLQRLRKQFYYGSPLHGNWAASWIDDLSEEPTQAQMNALPDLYRFKQGADLIQVANSPLVSAGDLLNMPYMAVTKSYQYQDTGEYGEFGVAGRQMLGAEAVSSPLLGKAYPQDRNALVASTSADVSELTAAQARFTLLYPHLDVDGFDTVADWQAVLQWQPVNPGSLQTTSWEPPQVWRPLFLYPLRSQECFFHLPGLSGAVDFGRRGEANNRFNDNFLFASVTQAMDVSDQARRWPVQRRSVVYVAGNLDDFRPELHDHTEVQPGATEALFEWDARPAVPIWSDFDDPDDRRNYDRLPELGIENGDYDLYIDTGGSLARLVQSDITFLTEVRNITDLTTVSAEYENGLLSAFGRSWLQDLYNPASILGDRPEEQIVDAEVFTDRNADGRCWNDTNGNGRIDPGEFTRGEGGDSYGLQSGLTPDADGIIHYGAVRVENNYLALRLRSWRAGGAAGNRQVVRFAGLILAPRNRASGRININTVETRDYNDGDRRAFNALMGIPGIAYEANGSQPATLTPPIIPSDALPALDVNGATAQDRLLSRSRLVEVGRPTHWDGRYYKFTSDLVPLEPYSSSLPAGITSPLSAAPGPYYTISGAQYAPNNEVTFRYSRMAELITTRSDVFEIIVTVQTGYGVDADSNGQINYRNDAEFIVTSEKKTRTVYER